MILSYIILPGKDDRKTQQSRQERSFFFFALVPSGNSHTVYGLYILCHVLVYTLNLSNVNIMRRALLLPLHSTDY